MDRYYGTLILLIIFLLVHRRWKIGVKAAICSKITFIIDNHRVTPQGLVIAISCCETPFTLGINASAMGCYRQ
jgi:NAD dependent epimerase/dehydratase family enzyme